MILNTLFIFIFTYFSINKFRESLDRRYLLVPSPAFLPKYTIIARYIVTTGYHSFSAPQNIYVFADISFTFIHQFYPFLQFFNAQAETA